MYRNLEAELARHRITRKKIAEIWGVRQATVSDKLNGKYKISLEEALKLKIKLFPELSIEYLFEKAIEDEPHNNSPDQEYKN